MENPDLIDPALLLLAYRGGVFPMADSRDDPEIFWVEPKRRGILPLDGFRVSHSLARSLRRGKFTVTCNTAFDLVLDACAAPRRAEAEDGGETWISERIAASYRELHRLGHAHSIECWIDGALVGGLYGVGFERVFCGESMFSRVPDASKVALAWLVAAMRIGGAELLDCQFITSHLASLGAVEIPQKRYLAMLREAMRPKEPGLPVQSGFSGLGAGAAGAGAASALGVVLALPDAFGALLETAKSAGFSSSPGKFIAQSLTQTS
ncbi:MULTISPECIES: leucyl/phenylalanyl-tRNA--protein transferase [unclassified Novosphingobium]|uniref:leucyl/phenylalanyl-tRNA--protein transferase n=1 Tax=unclassified Novosphingobium TaxID=2644732 RepID=UPI000AADD0F9|nr:MULTISPECIES: leucyl/phenylalanyl-tRNA--protein transferase [unclassified Novosphingobium]MBN9143013.1 leucyl/phenylalanyl-tRNA--protein transferase [Novosphingobium sp.]MDR6706099.1 leucyl/phenylalanyl-tRNA--protein transferase [Novosphingobium sp. 1748]NKJ02554.1 leucyl/phenylalanyl-tRNA--protein transferase [Novosphingobium sp. SG707]